jgi:hypothetical protein
MKLDDCLEGVFAVLLREVPYSGKSHENEIESFPFSSSMGKVTLSSSSYERQIY